jgi:hypothetical protein
LIAHGVNVGGLADYVLARCRAVHGLVELLASGSRLSRLIGRAPSLAQGVENVLDKCGEVGLYGLGGLVV